MGIYVPEAVAEATLARYQAGIRTEGRIIEATRELLSESGLEGTTLKAICARAGIQAGSFYNLFASKEEAVLRVIAEAIAAADAEPLATDTETVDDLIAAYGRFVEQQPELARIYVQLAASGGLTDEGVARRFLGHHQRRLQRLAAAIERCQPDLAPTEITARAELVLATLNGLAFHWMLEPDFDLTSHADRLAAISRLRTASA